MKSMYIKRFSSMFFIFCLISFYYSPTMSNAELKLNNRQQRNADILADVCIENYEKYGVLPSVCIAQALEESQLGEHCPGNNLWGICSGSVHYSDVADGTLAYLKVINNGYYKDAPFEKSYKKQIRAILDGGYCVPEGTYYSDVLWLIDKYNLTKYDNKLKKYLKQKRKEEKERKRIEKENKRKEKWNETYNIKYNPNLDEYTVMVDEKIIKSGTISIYVTSDLNGIYDIIPGSTGNTIEIGDIRYDNKECSIMVDENSVG